MSGPFGSSQWMYASGGFYDFPISNSLRLEDGDSAYLNFTPSSAGNRKTWTWSGWVKFSGSDNGAYNTGLFYGGNGGVLLSQSPNSAHHLRVYAADSNTTTTMVFRDYSGWYHIVASIDTTQATAADRVRTYVNGVRITEFDTETYPDQDAEGTTNNADQLHWIGNSGDRYLDGYLAEVNFIDGAALTPSSFGEYKNDIWIPKNTAGLTFGTNGFRLEFKQVGTGTASSSTIGADTSGEDNHWTSNNLVASDVVPDSPTNNFATMNPLEPNVAALSLTLSEGNLKASGTAYGATMSGSTAFINTLMGGKWYYEQRMSDLGRLPRLGWKSASNTIMYRSNGEKNIDGTESSYGATFADGDIISIAADVDGSSVTFFKNGASQGAISYTFVAGQDYTNAVDYGGPHGEEDGAFVMNFGQDSSFAGTETAQGNADGNGIGDFYYAPPSGFLALCTSNLPDPVEAIDPNEGGSVQDYFNTLLWAGDAGTNRAISGLDFTPDLVWVKERTSTSEHQLTDSVRGVTKRLHSSTTGAETTSTNSILSFNTDGFNIGDSGAFNASGDTYVAWNWKAGTAFSNDASATSVGSIDSTGSVNTDIGFSIISWTGTGSNGTIAHGLGVTPEMYIVKRRDADGHSWPVYTSTLGATKQLRLSGTNAEITTANIWNNTEPTSSVFSVGTNTDSNASSGTHIAYCFASVDGFSKVGSYTGNGNADGPFVYTGFAPAFLMIKNTSRAEDWAIVDNRRGVEPTKTEYLAPNNSAAEIDSVARASFVSNGFKIRAAGTYTFNHTSGDTYIYMAFAEQPFKYANAR